ncbi:MAG TPA: hypothetical protein VL172_08575, partial [Kofleriaceae bacterium]|nr:hypothetical protein [Kofleriaceae bacterium]
RDDRRVDLVLASGRQQQVYATRDAGGAHRLLPVVWSTTTRQWLPLSLYQPADVDPASPRWWGAGEMTRTCLGCHLGQVHRVVGAGGGRTAWIDLSINCESCHGPGREHVARRRAGRTDEVLRDLAKLGSAEEARVCGACHGLQLHPYALPRAADGLPDVAVASLAATSLRPDGTQRLTSYQYTGHVLTGGYRMELMTCNDCHQPHALTARNRKGASAEGDQVNVQCTVCHPDRATPAGLTAHSHHTPKTTCIDCHMPYTWIGDDDRRHQRTADHSISSAHPRETLELGIPNACNSCHRDKDPQWSLAALQRWGKQGNLGLRPWVQAIAAGRRTSADASERLYALLTDRDTGTYLRISALDLLALQPPDDRIAAAAEARAADPDPQLRAAALRALDRHDPAELTPAALDRALADVLAFQSPPTEGLLRLIDLRRRRGELAEALALLDLLDRISVPWERARPDFAALRARIEAGSE